MWNLEISLTLGLEPFLLWEYTGYDIRKGTGKFWTATLGDCISRWGPSTFWPKSYKKQFFISFMFDKDLMKSLYFPKNSSRLFFCDPCFYWTAQKFRVLDYVILLCAIVLGITLRVRWSICFHWSSFLVGEAYLRKADAFNHNKKE